MSLQDLASQLIAWQDHLLDLPKFMDEQKYLTAFETLKLFFLNPQVPQSQVRESCTHLLRLVPHLNPREQQDLLQVACSKLLHFPALLEERIAVLKCAGDIHSQLDDDLDRSLSQASLALHHYTAAFALSPSEEIHVVISQVFSHLSQLQFRDLLDQARRRGAAPFEQFLHTIPRRHLCFSTQPEEIQAYYAHATSTLINISPEAHQDFGHLSAFVLTERKKLVATPLCLTQRYHQELAKVRKIFSEPISAQEMQEKSFGHFTAFLKLLFEEAMLILGEPPCPFDIRLTGSSARRELCPYSDIEYFILIEDNKHRPYFKRLAQLFEMQILALAESDHGYVVPAYSTQFGLQIDPQSNPARDESLICQPDAFMAKLAVSTDDPEMLKALTSYLGSYSLFSNSMLGNISAPEKALQLIKQFEKEQKPLGTIIDLKGDLMAPLVYRLRSYALYHNIPETNTLQLIDALPFDALNKILLKEAVSILYMIRVRIHLTKGCTHETASTVPHLELPVLSQDEKEAIDTAYHLAITSLYAAGSFDRDVDLLALAFRNPSSPTVCFGGRFLARQGVSIPVYEKYYRMLLGQDQISLQKNYLDQLPRPAALKLAQIPSRTGYRQSMRLDEERLGAVLAESTTGNPASGVKVRCPLIGECYLTQEAANFLLENGHIKKAYSQSLHNVAEYGGLHFKELPYQPLMEYAIHSLTYRVMGKATPTTTLARFEVNGVVYPVLISETLRGSAPQAPTPLDPRHLTALRLCEILTKPGDGRLSNYIVSGETIFCIDNDISFREPVIKEMSIKTLKNWDSRRVAFCSALFTFPQPLDPDVLQYFCTLEPDLILEDWLRELQAREESYKSLFSENELRILYDLDEKRHFSPTLLLPKGAIANLCLQFHHLQNVLRNNSFTDPLLLLRELVSLNDSDKSQVGILVESQYRKALSKPFILRLETATASRQDQSMTSARAMQINYKKIPTFAEIQKKGSYSLKEAVSELYLLEVQNQVFIVQKGQTYGLEVDFRNIQDIERQKLILNALQHLYETRKRKPSRLTLRRTALSDKVLRAHLNPHLRMLDLSYCPEIKDNAIAWIDIYCPKLEELHLEGCAGIVNFKTSPPLLKRLNLGRCANLKTINTKSPLDELRIHHCPQLTRVDVVARKEIRVDGNGSPQIKEGWTDWMTQQQQYLKAIALDPNDATAYNNLGTTLSGQETIRLPDGTEMTKQQLYLKAIALNPNNADAYYSLGKTLSGQETIRLPDGAEMSKHQLFLKMQQLYLKAIALNPNNADAYYSLGKTLSGQETIRLPDGIEMTKQQLYLKAIALNPNDGHAYYDLGNTLSREETIRLPDGTVMTQELLHYEAIMLLME